MLLSLILEANLEARIQEAVTYEMVIWVVVMWEVETLEVMVVTGETLATFVAVEPESPWKDTVAWRWKYHLPKSCLKWEETAVRIPSKVCENLECFDVY
jgi:hypothetical protein